MILHADRTYKVVTPCPACGEVEVIPVALAARLETTRAGAQIGIRAKPGKVDHACGQIRIPVPGVDTGTTVDTGTGEIVGPEGGAW